MAAEAEADDEVPPVDIEADVRRGYPQIIAFAGKRQASHPILDPIMAR